MWVKPQKGDVCIILCLESKAILIAYPVLRLAMLACEIRYLESTITNYQWYDCKSKPGIPGAPLAKEILIGIERQLGSSLSCLHLRFPSRFFKTQYHALHIGTGGGGRVAVMSTVRVGIDITKMWVSLLGAGCVVDLIVIITDVDCHALASDWAMESDYAYGRDVLDQCCGDPKGGERQIQASPSDPRYHRRLPLNLVR